MNINIRFLFMTTLAVLFPICSSDCNVCICMLQKGVKIAYCSKTLNPLDKFNEDINIIYFNNQNIPNISNSKLSHLKNIQKLFISNSQVQNIEENAFHNLTVVTLDLSHNKIKDVKINTFHNVKKLKYLKLGNNNIKIIQNGLFTNLNILEEISLENNQISVIEEHAFANNIQLRSLDLSGNQLRKLNLNLGKKLSDLEHLELARNPWICNCQTKDLLQDLWNYDFFNEDPECFYPEVDKHVPWRLIKPEDYSCFPKVTVNSNLNVIRENETVILSCKIESFYRTLIKWTTNDKLISDASSDKIIPVGGSTHIFWFNLTVHGNEWIACQTFDCVADNAIGNEHKNVQVIVDRDLPVILSPMNEYIEADSENVIITSLVYSKTELFIKQIWFYKHSMEDRHPQDIKHKRVKYELHSPDADVITEYKMTIANITSKDAGVYTFVVENEFGQANNSIQLNVNSSLSVQTSQPIISVNLGVPNYTLQCTVKSIEYPVIDWLYNGKQLSNNDKYVFGVNKFKATYLFSLTVNHLNKNDGGEYTCRGKNSEGSETQLQILEIKFKDPQVQLVHKWFGNEVRLICTVESIPISSVTWYFEENYISDNTHTDIYTITHRDFGYTTEYILTIQNVSASEYGNYSCLANNGISDSLRYHMLLDSNNTHHKPFFNATNITIVILVIICILLLGFSLKQRIINNVSIRSTHKTFITEDEEEIEKELEKQINKQSIREVSIEMKSIREVSIEMKDFAQQTENLYTEQSEDTNTYIESSLDETTSLLAQSPTFNDSKAATLNTSEETKPVVQNKNQIPSVSGISKPVRQKLKSLRKNHHSQSSSSADEGPILPRKKSYRLTTNIPSPQRKDLTQSYLSKALINVVPK